jgi:Family of unknown function (DUF6491)
MRIRLPTLILAAGLSALVGCTAVPQSHVDAQATSGFMQYASAPIDSFTDLGQNRDLDFRTLGRQEFVIFANVNDAYLVRTQEPCFDLRTENVIGLTSTNRTVTRKFDFVTLSHDRRCHIAEMRKVDYLAMKRDHAVPL